MRHWSTNSGPAARWIAPSTPPPPSKDSLAALTIASTSSRVMSPSMTSRRVMVLPVADRTGIEMDEAGARVEAHAAHLQRARRLPDLEHRHAREADVHRVAVHVLAVLRHAAADARQPGIVLGRAVARQHIYCAVEAGDLLGVPQHVEQQRIHLGLLAGLAVAQEVIELVQ